jgi:hypothetical protein
MKKALESLDEPIEWMGWIVMLAGLVLLVIGNLTAFEGIGVMAFGAITAVGVRRYRGVRIGKEGLEIRGEDSPRLGDDEL